MNESELFDTLFACDETLYTDCVDENGDHKVEYTIIRLVS